MPQHFDMCRLRMGRVLWPVDDPDRRRIAGSGAELEGQGAVRRSTVAHHAGDDHARRGRHLEGMAAWLWDDCRDHNEPQHGGPDPPGEDQDGYCKKGHRFCLSPAACRLSVPRRARKRRNAQPMRIRIGSFALRGFASSSRVAGCTRCSIKQRSRRSPRRTAETEAQIRNSARSSLSGRALHG